MFKKIANMANLLDKQGRYEEADIFTKVLTRLSAAEDISGLGVADIQRAEKSLNDMNDVSGIVDEPEVVDEPEIVQQENNEIREGTPTDEPSEEQSKKGIKRILNLATPEHREEFLEFLEPQIGSDPYAKIADWLVRQIITAINGEFAHMIRSDKTVGSGNTLIESPYARTWSESSNPTARGGKHGYGGRHLVTPLLRSFFQSVNNNKNFVNMLKQGITGNRQNMRFLAKYAGDAPNMNMDIIIALGLNAKYKPYEEITNFLLSTERANQGYEMNTTPLKPGQFRAFPHSNYNKINPKTRTEDDFEWIRNSVLENLARFVKISNENHLGYPLDVLIECAKSKFFLGLMHTYRKEDMLSEKRYAPKGKNSYMNDPVDNKLGKEIAQGLEDEHKVYDPNELLLDESDPDTTIPTYDLFGIQQSKDNPKIWTPNQTADIPTEKKNLLYN